MDIPDPDISTRKGTCYTCRKVRKLYTRDKWWEYCDECKDLTVEARAVKYAAVNAVKKAAGPKPRFAYPCVGGPLNGEHATRFDFWTDGMYSYLANEYVEFNNAHGGGYGSSKKLGDPATMLFIHTSLIGVLISPRNR